VLALDSEAVLEPDFHHHIRPSDLIAWAQSADVDAELARLHSFSQRDQ
jgi:ribosomal protein L16 Arg81 hydroxylase